MYGLSGGEMRLREGRVRPIGDGLLWVASILRLLVWRLVCLSTVHRGRLGRDVVGIAWTGGIVRIVVVLLVVVGVVIEVGVVGLRGIRVVCAVLLRIERLLLLPLW